MANVQPRRPRNIVILCDGTGKNGQRDSVKGQPITNIWRLYQAIQPQEGDIIEYLPGVGAHNDGVTAMDLLAQTFGHTAVIAIRKIYMTIVENYRDGDSISLFGYSRGAFIARKVASLIGALGLITDEAEFNQYWEGMEHKLPGSRSTPRPPNPRVVPISCLGAVRPRAIREVLNLLTLPDNDLPEIVQSALHVVAYHENRKLFDVVLFDANNGDKQLCKQTLFPGSHSDVGGGAVEPKSRRNILPDVTLDWMLRNMPQTIRATTSEKLESDVPSWYPINSAFHDSPFWKRIPDKLHQREYLPTRYGLFRHRTLLGLPSPKSPHLLKHMWREWEHFNSPEEEANGPPAVKSLMRRITDRAKSSMTPTWDRPALPLTPESPTFSADTTRSADLQLPQQRRSSVRSRLDSSTTNQTDFTTDTLDTVSTPRTSLASADIAPEIRAWLLADAPESPSNPVRTSLLPIAEDAHPVTEKTEKPEKPTLGAEGGLPTPPDTPNRIGPVAGKPAPTEPVSPSRRAVPGRAGAQARPAPAQGRPGPAQIPTVAAGPAAQARPGPAPVSPAPTPTRPGPAQARPAPAPVAPAQVPVAPGQARPGLVRVPPPVGSAVPAGHTPAQAGRAPVQVLPGPTQDYPAAQVDPTVPARPTPAQVGSSVPTSHTLTQPGPAPAQAGPTPVQTYSTAPVGSATPAGPVPAQGRPGPAQVPPTPVLAQVPVGPVVQAHPDPVQTGPAPAIPVSPGQVGSATLANRTPAQISLVPAQAPRAPAQPYPSVGHVALPAPAGPAPTRAGPGHAQSGPRPAQVYPSVAQVGSGVPTSRAPAQADRAPIQVPPVPAQPGPPAQLGPAARFPTAAQSYPTALVSPTIVQPLTPTSAGPVTQADLGAGFTIRDRSAAQAGPSIAQASPAAPTGPSPGQAGRTPVQTGRASAQVPRAPAQTGPGPIQVRPGPVQAYPSAARAGSAFPAGHAPGQAGAAPVQAGPGPAQVRPGPVQAYPAVGQVSSATLASRTPAQVGPVSAQASPIQAPRASAQTYPSVGHVGPGVPAGPAPARAGPGYAQVGPGVPTRRAPAQADPAFQSGPAARFPAAPQVYPTGSVGSTIRNRSAPQYSPDIRTRLDAIQTRPTVGAHPTSQAYLTAPVGYAAQARAAPQVQPNRPRQKKGVMQKIKAFFCCGSSGQMIG